MISLLQSAIGVENNASTPAFGSNLTPGSQLFFLQEYQSNNPDASINFDPPSDSAGHAWAVDVGSYAGDINGGAAGEYAASNSGSAAADVLTCNLSAGSDTPAWRWTLLEFSGIGVHGYSNTDSSPNATPRTLTFSTTATGPGMWLGFGNSFVTALDGSRTGGALTSGALGNYAWEYKVISGAGVTSLSMSFAGVGAFGAVIYYPAPVGVFEEFGAPSRGWSRKRGQVLFSRGGEELGFPALFEDSRVAANIPRNKRGIAHQSSASEEPGFPALLEDSSLAVPPKHVRRGIAPQSSASEESGFPALFEDSSLGATVGRNRKGKIPQNSASEEPGFPALFEDSSLAVPLKHVRRGNAPQSGTSEEPGFHALFEDSSLGATVGRNRKGKIPQNSAYEEPGFPALFEEESAQVFFSKILKKLRYSLLSVEELPSIDLRRYYDTSGGEWIGPEELLTDDYADRVSFRDFEKRIDTGLDRGKTGGELARFLQVVEASRSRRNRRMSLAIGLGAAVFAFEHLAIRLGAALGATVVAFGKDDLSPETRALWQTIVENTRDPIELFKLASALEDGGAHEHAEILRRRAGLFLLSSEKRRELQDIWRRAMVCNDADKRAEIAELFDELGAFEAAKQLRKT